MTNKNIVFKKLDLSSRKEVTELTTRFDPYSDFNFVSLFCWNTDGNTRYAIHNQNLIIELADYMGGDKILSLLGDRQISETLDDIFLYIKQEGRAPEVKLVPEIVVNNMKGSKYKYKEDADNHDYVLSTELLSEMRSSEFRGKRSSLNKFIRNYGDDTRLTSLNLSDVGTVNAVLRLCNKWALNGNKADDEVDDEFKAIRLFLDNAHKLKVEGIGVFDGDELIAFSLIEICNNNHGVIHFEKADVSYGGIYAYLKQNTAKKIRENGIDFINYEQDLGIEGLRKAKQLHHPVKFYRKFIIYEA